jgi:hypothetical protein
MHRRLFILGLASVPLGTMAFAIARTPIETQAAKSWHILDRKAVEGAACSVGFNRPGHPKGADEFALRAVHNGLWIDGISIVGPDGKRVQHKVRDNIPEGRIVRLQDMTGPIGDVKGLRVDVTCLPLRRSVTGVELLVLR